MAQICNPVLRGFNPDPSICRKDSAYYIVTSTFEYFPMLPVYRSYDLASWQYIGSCIDKEDSLITLSGCRSGKGIYAPCIRYNPHDGFFYVVTTLVRNDDYFQNICFYIKSRDPAGPWSSPIAVKGAEGIDPSFFFDDDGTAYIIGNMRPEPGNQANRHRYIWIDTINLATGTLGGRKEIILRDGAVRDAVCPEGPRLMKRNGWYYVLLAEGGTEHNHAESVFRSRSPFGPYEMNPRNPVLTHRMLARSSEFNSIGHADLFDTPDDRWFCSALGVRPYMNPFLRNIGRETFIAPVTWEDDWPVFAPDTGKVERCYDSGIASNTTAGNTDYPLFLRSDCNVALSGDSSEARLQFPAEDITGTEAASFIGWRQTEKDFSLSAMLEAIPKSPAEAGLAIMLSSGCFYRLACRNGRLYAEDQDGGIWEADVKDAGIHLKAECHGIAYRFQYSEDGSTWQDAGPLLDGSRLSQLEFGFTGVVFGLYATGNGRQMPGYAAFSSIKHGPSEA